MRTAGGVAGAFSTPAVHRLEKLLWGRGQRVCYMAEYFLPDVERLAPLPCRYPVRLLEPEQFQELYVPAWSNALCDKRRELDVLAVGAYDGRTLIGLAGCSADCEAMWQIGIDAAGLPAAWRGLRFDQPPGGGDCHPGEGSLLLCGMVQSAFGAQRSVQRLLPAWVEMTAKPAGFVENMLG